MNVEILPFYEAPCPLESFMNFSPQVKSVVSQHCFLSRHACYLLEMLHQHMTQTDATKVSTLLDGIVKAAWDKCISSPKYAASVAGKLVSPIPLNHFPLVQSFFPRPLIKMMAPLRREGFKTTAAATRNLPTNELKAEAGGKASGGEGSGKEGGATNPFIYSPFGPGGRKKTVKRKEILWVVKDPAEMALSISNPLPFELRVENMVLHASRLLLVCPPLGPVHGVLMRGATFLGQTSITVHETL